MNKRNFVRYNSDLLSPMLSKATLTWNGRASITSNVVNCSAQGINLRLPSLPIQSDIPAQNDEVKVLLPVHQRWFTGRCVHVERDSEGTVSLGIHFTEPSEQEILKTSLFHSLNTVSHAGSFVSYEWEELVAKLCNSDNPKLKKIGRHHLATIQADQDLH